MELDNTVKLEFNFLLRDWNIICIQINRWYTHSTGDNYGEGNVNKAGLDTFQIVLIVVCVALAIGLIVALVVLLRYGK